jgi:hypothetical protein
VPAPLPVPCPPVAAYGTLGPSERPVRVHRDDVRAWIERHRRGGAEGGTP